MIYYYEKNIDTAGFECQENVFVFYSDQKGTIVSTEDVMNNKSCLQQVVADGGEIKFAVLPGGNTPVLTIDDVKTCNNITSVMSFVERAISTITTPDEQATMLKKIIAVLEKSVSHEEASLVVAACQAQLLWEKEGSLSRSLILDVSEVNSNFRATTMKFINELNAQFVQAITSIPPADNYTYYQDACDSELFIEIPSRQMLIADSDKPLLSFIPKRDEVCNPYSDKAAYEPGYAANGVPSYMFPLIEGTKANNKAELYENEKKYYTALSEWVEYNVKQDFGTDDGMVIDLISQKYLLELMTCLYMWHWGHNPCVPIDILPESFENEVEEGSRFTFRKEAADYNYNAVIILQQFLKEASTKLGWKIYLSAIIQLARWGERKPTRIVFEDYEKEFDLGTGLVKSKIGDINDYTLKEINGKESRLIGIIMDDATVQDMTVGVRNHWSFPVGVVLEKQMESKKGETISVINYVPCIDVVELALCGELSVDGISYTGGIWDADDSSLSTYTMSGLIKSYEQHKETIMQFPFYRSNQLKDWFVEMQANNARIPANLLCIMSTRVADPRLKEKLKRINFTDREGLLSVVRDGIVPSIVAAAELGIVKKCLPIYEKVEEENATTLQDTLKAFQKYKDVKPVTEPNKPVERVQGVTPVSSFGSTQQSVAQPVVQQPVSQPTPQAAVQPVVQSDTWLKIVPADAALIAITSDGETIGYCCKEKLPTPGKANSSYVRYTIVSEETIVLHPKAAEPPIPMERIFALITHNLYLNEVGSHGLKQIFFENSNAISKFRDSLQAIFRKKAGQ